MFISEFIKGIGECIGTETVLFFRSRYKWFIGGMWVVLMILFSISAFECGVIGDGMTSSGWVTQGLLTMGMMLGVLCSSEERKTDCEEVILSEGKAYRNTVIAKAVLVLMIGLLFMVTGIGLVFCIFLIRKAAACYYLPTAAYIVLYWILPFIISGVLGCVLGITVRTKTVYVLAVIFSIMLGPCIPFLLSELMFSRKGSLYELFVMFNVGQLETDEVMSEAFGYCLNPELWGARLCILGAFIILLATVAEKKLLKRRAYLSVALIFSIMLFGIGTIVNNQMVRTQVERYRQKELLDYYSESRDTEPAGMMVNGTESYKILGYVIRVDDGLKLKITTEVDVDIRNESEAMVFSLFHDFDVYTCRIDNEICDFDRNSDSLTVWTNGKFSGRHKLEVKYEGVPPLNLYKAGNKWILPGMFVWIPVEYVGEITWDNADPMSLFRYPDNKENVPISVDYLGNNAVHCSLKMSENGHWEGYSSGVTLATGWFEEKSIEDINVIYPSIYPENLSQALKYLRNLQAFIPVISEEMTEERINVEPDKVFVIPSIVYTHFSSGTCFFSDHVVVCLDSDRGGYLLEQNDARTVLNGFLRTPEWQSADSHLADFFIYGYIDSLAKRGKYAFELLPSLKRLTDSIANYEKNYEMAELGRKIQDYIDNNGEKEQTEFFRGFIRLLNDGNASVGTVLDLMD